MIIYDASSRRFNYLLRLLNDTKIFCGRSWRVDTLKIKTPTTMDNNPNVLGLLNIVIFALFEKEFDMEGDFVVETSPRYGRRVWEKLNDSRVTITF